MMGPFEAYEPAALRVPIRGDFGQLVAGTAGQLRDDEVELLRISLLARLPARCPDDALEEVGRAYGIERYPGESHASYRGRLVDAWPTRETQGSPESVEGQLRAYGLPDVRCYMAHELAFLPTSPIAYSPFTSPPYYNAFVVVLGPDFGATGIGPQLAPFVAGPECTSGSTATRTQVRAICNIILRWSAAHSYPVGVALRFGDTAIGGINTTAPFTPPPAPQYCFWNIGKLIGVNIFTGPFVAGGYLY